MSSSFHILPQSSYLVPSEGSTSHTPSSASEILLYHYPFSPYARKVLLYLALRRIPHTAVPQPPVLPRPDLAQKLGLRYRRIPVAAVAGEVFVDSRLIIAELQRRYPPSSKHPNIARSKTPEQRALLKLLDRWTTDAGIFARAAQAIPAELPLMKDDKFLRDRAEFTGRRWSAEAQAKGRAEAVAHLRDGYELLEKTLLGDGRKWIFGGDKPSLADIEAGWVFLWLDSMPGAMPKDVVERYPKVKAWVERFKKAAKEAEKKLGKQNSMGGEEAAREIFHAARDRRSDVRGVDRQDPTGLKEGDQVIVAPIDSGFAHKDQGTLKTLQHDKIVIAIDTPDGHELLVHFPRWGFRISAAQAKANL